ncbi:BrnT family toxin [Panacagrimonas sp.]|uniref:BrnT family toxin n=1 Tax=Panacagrimonas sp. TaxID=2480088 RepID=UPI003B52B89A
MTYDPPKRKKNLRKHAIDLAECEPVFDAPMLTREDTREAYGEQRLDEPGMVERQSYGAGVDRPRGRPPHDFM